jgi:hypothetical protein
MASYQRVPSRPEDVNEVDEHDLLTLDNPHTASTMAEFNRPAPAWWKRGLLIFAVFFLGWMAVKLGGLTGDRKPKVIYATR